VKPAVLHAIWVSTRSLWVRFHMALILFAVLLAGIATSYLLLRILRCQK